MSGAASADMMEFVWGMTCNQRIRSIWQISHDWSRKMGMKMRMACLMMIVFVCRLDQV